MKEFSSYFFKQTDETITAYDGLDAMRVFSSFGVVFLHVCVSTGVPASLELLIKIRDFSLPVLVMSSFFLLTVSLKRKPEALFGQFFSRRFFRLWLPFLIWTFIYVLFSDYMLPLMKGVDPSDTADLRFVFLTGYRHLWYLQFIFIGSLVFFPVVLTIIRNISLSRLNLFLLCLASGIVYWHLYYFVTNRSASWQSFNANAEINLQIFASQAIFYLTFIPAAIGIGLIADKLDKLFRNLWFRRITLAAALLTTALHLSGAPFAATREVYGAAVFLAALLPWKKIALPLWQKLVAYSYGIYILHFFGAQVLFIVLSAYNLELGGSAIVGAALLIYLLSFAFAVGIRRLLPFDWFLPLVRESNDSSFYYPILRLGARE